MRVQPAPEKARLLELIDAFEDQKILMVVDLIADRFITGTPRRISREAPVLIIQQERDEIVPGGGANAVLNVRTLGGCPHPIGVVGDDQTGERLLEKLATAGISTDGILIRPNYPTACKTRILGGARHTIKQQIVRLDLELPGPLSANELKRFEDHARGLDCRVAVFSDYGLGSVDPGLLSRVSNHPILCLGDSRYRLDDFKGLSGATPNEDELESIEGAIDSAAAKRLRLRLEADFLLVTRGSSGMSLVLEDGVVEIQCSGSSQVVDVTGAGDTVIGTFALASSAGATPLEAALLANYAGGIVVHKSGTATLDRDELRTAVEGDPVPRETMRWEG